MIQARLIAAVIAITAPLLVGLGALLFVVLLAVSGTQEEGAGQRNQCAPSWVEGGVESRQLSQSQLDAAATIYKAALETGVGTRGAVIGIATALQESDLGDAPGAYEPNSDGDMGLFQQRYYLGWYANGDTLEENKSILQDNMYAARTFFAGNDTTKGYHIPGLVDIANWQNLPLTEAAQAVQVSAYPNAYAKHETLAQELVAKLTGGGSVVCGPVGPAGECPMFNASLENGLSSDAIRVLRCTKHLWPEIVSWSVLRPGDSRDHGKGNAVDAMIPNWRSESGIQLGKEIAEYYRANAAAYGITYIIWREEIWSVARSSEGWRSCASGSCYTGPDDTSAHRDHVHISVQGSAGAGLIQTSGGAAVNPLPKGTYIISSRYGPRWGRMHFGIDFAAPTGTPIYAPIAGTVSFVGELGGYGKLIKLNTGETDLYFGHLNEYSVIQGQQVTQGELIGFVGNTGHSTGPHLHFEVRVNGSPINPEPWLMERGVAP